jgi:hypothetical protein
MMFIALGLVLFALPGCAKTVRIDQETCDKIKPGMTLKEVEDIIGGPPGFYGVVGVQSEAPSSKDGWSWVSRRWEIVVHLNNNQKVMRAKCYRVRPLD